jgi:FkbM family methyltransferase
MEERHWRMILNKIKRIVARTINQFGYDLHRIPDPFIDQKNLIKGITEPVIFDVGAHHGQTSITYLRLFKDGLIYSFEPYAESFKYLSTNVKGYDNIRPFNVALGNKIGKLNFYINLSSGTNSLLPADAKAPETWSDGLYDNTDQIEVDVVTIDSFVEKYEIKQIDLLKLDTQGTEYQIIEGADKAFSEGRIKVIYTEIITMPTYIGQKELHEVLRIIQDKGFRLHNFYNYSLTNGRLRQVDAIFTHNDL